MTNSSITPSASPVIGESLDLYMQEVEKYPLLSAQEEIELAMRYHAGDAQAGEHFINCNLRLVVKVAHVFNTNARVTLLDLIQEGNIGLIRAARKFDPQQGYRFSSYAQTAIMQECCQYRDEQGYAVRLPQYIAVDVRKSLRDAEHTPNPSRVIAQRWLSESCVSYDVPMPDGHDTFAARIADAESEREYAQVLASIDTASFLGHLPDHYRSVFELLYGLNGKPEHTFRQVGNRYGVSATRIQQIEKQGLIKMRRVAFCGEEVAA
jgi:RNA polymerase sigma factor (sigma-70 family)